MTRSINCDVCGAEHGWEEVDIFCEIDLPGEWLGVEGERGKFDICSIICLLNLSAQLSDQLPSPDEPTPEALLPESLREEVQPKNGSLKPMKFPQVEDVDLPPAQPMPEVTRRT